MYAHAGRWPLAALIAAIVLGIGMPAESWASVPPKYELIEVDIIGFEPNVDTQGRFGINNRGEIAYTKKSGASSRAMLYLPKPAYGFDTSQSSTINLTDVFGTITVPEEDGFLYGPSYARDISDSGFIVGQFGGVQRFEGRAFVIDLADHMNWTGRSFSWKPVGLVWPCTSNWSRAMAVTGDADPAVVVEVGTSGQCVYVDCFPDISERCFPLAGLLTNLGVTTPQWTNVGAFPCGNQTSVFPSTRAVDAERSVVTGEVLLAGFAERWPIDPDGMLCPIEDEGGCDEPTTAIRWDPDGVVLEGVTTTVTRRPRAQGVSVIGEAVGYSSVEGPLPSTCLWNAAYWPVASTQPLNLHQYVNAVADESRAESINRRGAISQIVGWDPFNDIPLLWTKDGAGVWHGWALQVGGSSPNHAVIECDDCSNVTLRQAFDINDDGWIVVWGHRGNPSNPSANRLFLLKPIDVCGRAGDIDQSGDVDLTDLLLLLAAWGDCEHEWCPEDLNGDGQVTFTDLILLLDQWGCCDEPPVGLPVSVEDCIQRVGLDPVALSACLTAIP